MMPSCATINALNMPPASPGLGHATQELLVQAHDLCKGLHVAGNLRPAEPLLYRVSLLNGSAIP